MDEFLVDEDELLRKMKEAKTSFAYGTLTKNKFQSLEALCSKIQSLQGAIGYETKSVNPTTKNKLQKLHKEFSHICQYMDDSYIE